jgi:ABC-type Zn2+ transport system substrate-binding protein/surface adhesin
MVQQEPSHVPPTGARLPKFPLARTIGYFEIAQSFALSSIYSDSKQQLIANSRRAAPLRQIVNKEFMIPTESNNGGDNCTDDDENDVDDDHDDDDDDHDHEDDNLILWSSTFQQEIAAEANELYYMP